MLGRKEYTQEEYEDGKAAVAEQLDLYKELASVIDHEADKSKLRAGLEDFQGPFFNNMILMLDRPFVHRLRQVTGKDSNPLNEVEMLCDSLINNKGVLRDDLRNEPEARPAVYSTDGGSRDISKCSGLGPRGVALGMTVNYS